MRKLLYIVVILWVAAFIWQTIAHAKILFPPFPFDHNGSLMDCGLNLRTADNSARHRTAFSKSFVAASRTARPSTLTRRSQRKKPPTCAKIPTAFGGAEFFSRQPSALKGMKIPPARREVPRNRAHDLSGR